MAASPETKITFKLTGAGADPVSMDPQPEPEPVTPAPGSADTGIFTSSDGFSVGSVVFGAVLCLLLISAILISRSIAQPKMRKVSRGNSFQLKKGIFKKFGIFALLFVASAIALPNFLPKDDSASALIPADAKTVELTAGAGGSLEDAQATLSGTTGQLAHATETLTCKAACEIYMAVATTDNNLHYNNDTTKNWITAMSGTKAALTMNTWGYAVDISGTPSATSKIWSVVPAKGNEAKISETVEAGGSINVTFGAYVNNTIPAGNYSNTVVYTAVSPV